MGGHLHLTAGLAYLFDKVAEEVLLGHGSGAEQLRDGQDAIGLIGGIGHRSIARVKADQMHFKGKLLAIDRVL